MTKKGGVHCAGIQHPILTCFYFFYPQVRSPRDDWKQVIETRKQDIKVIAMKTIKKRHEQRVGCRLYSKKEERKVKVTARAQ